ncbi:MAG TPA: hypothetical protein PKY40_04240 [Burkholderiaceae bacterium]|nr:hypothetical protein [Burkholderiaceae bacterium]
MQRAIDQMGKKANGAIREALNRTAEWVATDVRREMPKVFDRPVPYTLRSLRVYYANSSKLKATVWFRQRSADLDKLWAAAQIGGGQRGFKPLELRLQRIGVLPKGWYVVPGDDAPKDAFGNMSAGEISRILNVLGAFTEAGYNKANDKTRARLRKGSVKKNVHGFEYFVVKPGAGKASHLLPGVYRRVYTGFGTSLKPMMIFVRGARYKKRLDFAGITKRTVAQRFPGEFKKAFDSLMKTGSASAGRRGIR